ncbi:hypothetical protein KEM52_005613 [Ascosphaera acerosa]|nr:hypothetical protein KEM52_005613 [Ascosphaera acerosa]
MNSLLAKAVRSTARRGLRPATRRPLSTLKENPAIVSASSGSGAPTDRAGEARARLTRTPDQYYCKDARHADTDANAHILTLLPTDPPTPELALGVATRIPPTPDSFYENPRFLQILDSVLKEWAARCPRVHAEAQVVAHQGGLNFRGGGMSTPGRTVTRKHKPRRGEEGAAETVTTAAITQVGRLRYDERW